MHFALVRKLPFAVAVPPGAVALNCKPRLHDGHDREAALGTTNLDEISHALTRS
jgi:hypothetical protein